MTGAVDVYKRQPVESAAAKYPMPATPEAAAAGSAAAALPENMKTAETIRAVSYTHLNPRMFYIKHFVR